jgi:hypothetical protein
MSTDDPSSQHSYGQDLKAFWLALSDCGPWITALAVEFVMDYLYHLNKRGEVGGFGRASPAQNPPHPIFLRRYDFLL